MHQVGAALSGAGALDISHDFQHAWHYDASALSGTIVGSTALKLQLQSCYHLLQKGDGNDNESLQGLSPR
jgi:hypothetical protein